VKADVRADVGKSAAEALAVQSDPFNGRQRYSREVIERALLQVALCGGNARKAARELEQLGIQIPHETISKWRRGRFANRYSEIVSMEAATIREAIAAEALELTIRVQEAEGRAVDQVLKGLASVDAMEASVILKNLAQTKQIALTQEGQLRGRAGVIVDVRGLDELTAQLVRAGVARRVDVELPADAVQELG
jgi:hypothetical protein